MEFLIAVNVLPNFVIETHFASNEIFPLKWHYFSLQSRDVHKPIEIMGYVL
jgi:hypothetical protein